MTPARDGGAKWRAEHPDYAAKYYADHRDEMRAASANRRAALRKAVLTHYGGRCVCCGEDREVFLALDHINGGGNAQRKDTGKWGTPFYLSLIINGYPPDMQILCHNCNMAKERGICPHQKRS